jgi:hypothetical protein
VDRSLVHGELPVEVLALTMFHALSCGMTLAVALAAPAALVACRQPARVSLDGDAKDVRSVQKGPGGTAAAPTPDDCGSALPSDLEIRLVAVPGYWSQPGDLRIAEGGLMDLSLFPIEGSGVGSDVVKCTLTDIGPSQLRVQCQDGPQFKSADVRLSGEHLDVEVDVDGAKTHTASAVRRCSRLVPEVPFTLDRSPIRPSRVCPDTRNATRIDAFLREGRPKSKSGFGPIVLDIPRLGIHKPIGEAVAGYCQSRLTKRGWVYVYCNDGEMAFQARVVATPGAITADLWDSSVEIPTPCDTQVVLHPLPCVYIDCDADAP